MCRICRLAKNRLFTVIISARERRDKEIERSKNIAENKCRLKIESANREIQRIEADHKEGRHGD